MKEIIRLFPEHFQLLLTKNVNWKSVQELRLRVHQAIEVLDAQGMQRIKGQEMSQKDLSYVLNQISQFSLYRFKDELKEGFITIEGGHRIGLAGKANTVDNEIETLKHISFMNIRVARSAPGQAEQFIPYLYDHDQWSNTLIIGPPHSGKTTLLREITKWIATDNPQSSASKVALVDERSEIAASLQGIPQLEVGERTDVMDACPKAEGMMMMIRSMSPEVLVVDEIGGMKDADAVREAIFTGVQIICTIHGHNLSSVMNRPSAKTLIEERIFNRYIVLERLRPDKKGSALVLDEMGQTIAHLKGRSSRAMDRSHYHFNGNNVGRF
ncbi:stage III sporulation protein AA [Halobacillus rhizosphaerae]|uniref:stage III sporulation protein AA n=1 Tax=Halobacillus rhizosphaerae TaxID=3064889 RepID=UPI00398B2B8D